MTFYQFTYLILFTWASVAFCIRHTPLRTQGASIVDSIGSTVRLKCVNWPAHMQTLLPEGLADVTPEKMAFSIQEMGFNCVRLTFSNELVEKHNNSALNAFDMHASTSAKLSIRSVNPWILSSTVWSVLERVLKALDSKSIMVILDNHVSKATWCCPLDDGNRWFLKEWFNVDEWIKVLVTVSSFVQDHSNVVGIGLRNELFKSPLKGFGFKEWLNYMSQAAVAVNTANPNLLIFAAGTVAAGNLGFLRSNPFVPQIKHKIVFESHIYNGIYVAPFWNRAGERLTCSFLQRFLLRNRNEFVTSMSSPRPYFLGEFGLDVQNFNVTSDSKDVKYLRCVADWVHDKNINFAYWVLVGKYYYRDGTQDYEESWGLLNSDNKLARNPSLLLLLKNL